MKKPLMAMRAWIVICCCIVASCGVIDPHINVEHSLVGSFRFDVFVQPNPIAGIKTQEDLKHLAVSYASNIVKIEMKKRYFAQESSRPATRQWYISHGGSPRRKYVSEELTAFRFVILESANPPRPGLEVFDAEKIKGGYWAN